MNYDHLLSEISLRGAQNAAAILTHKSIVAGNRGAFGRHKARRFLLRRKALRLHEIELLPNTRIWGTPIPTDGSRGYIRDRITGVITRCVAPSTLTPVSGTQNTDPASAES